MGKRARAVISRYGDGWFIGSLALATVLVLPLIFLVFSALQPAESWEHLARTVLGGYIGNTLFLMAGVAILSTALALPAAWLVAAADFPGRAIFQWLHLLPLAVPTYIAAYTAYEILQGAIPILLEIRKAFGIDWYLRAESTLRYGVLIFFLAGVLYPYLFLALQSAFRRQSESLLEAARTLGRSPRAIFVTISLPMARPALVAGLALISMEVLNEYGAIHFLGVSTLTEGIFRTWFGLNDPISAVRLASLAIAFVFFLLWLEKSSRSQALYTTCRTSTRPRKPVILKGWRAGLAIGICIFPLLGGLAYPVYILLTWAIGSGFDLPARTGQAFFQSAMLSGGAALLVLAMALLLNFAVRLHKQPVFQALTQLPALGYAVPGAVIGAGILMLGQETYAHLGWVLSGTFPALLLGYSLRFLAVAYHPLNSSMTQLCGRLEEASRCLGHGPASTLRRIHLPLLSPVMIGIGILAFVDILKELPLTLILRPAGLETLSTRIFGLASEGRLEDCAAPALLLMALAAAGILLGNWFYRRYTLE